MISAEYVFYALVIFLLIVCIIFVYTWAKDINTTTIAINIAQKKLEQLGIVPGMPREAVLLYIVKYAERNPSLDVGCSDENSEQKLIVACLYLLRIELHLNRAFFDALRTVPGFTAVGVHLPKDCQIRRSVINLASSALSAPSIVTVDRAVGRLEENYEEVLQEQQERKAAYTPAYYYRGV